MNRTMNHSISQPTTSRWAGRLLAVAVAGTFVTVGATTAEAKMSPPEKPVTSHVHTEWPDPGPVHPNNDPCSMGGPVADASVNCDYDGEIDDGAAPPPWGGPGERIAVGRAPELEDAEDEAEAEASAVCHGNWVKLDFDADIDLTGPDVFTLTYECI